MKYYRYTNTKYKKLYCCVIKFCCTFCVCYSTCLLLSHQETQDPSAVLWLDEIQDAILRANQDTQEAIQCKNTHPLLYLFLFLAYVRRM